MVMWLDTKLHFTERVSMNSHCSVFWTWKQRSRGIGRSNHWPWLGYEVIMKDVEVVLAVNKCWIYIYIYYKLNDNIHVNKIKSEVYKP